MSGKQEQGTGPTPEWSHLFDVDQLSGDSISVQIKAPKAALKLLPRRLDVEDVTSLSADLTLERESGGLIVHVAGTLEAQIKQSCVVTGESVDSTVEEEVETWFSDPAQAISFAKEKRNKLYEKGNTEAPILEEQDDPEVIIDGKIELGDTIVQFLSLAIDPYPHAPGVEYEDSGLAVHEEGGDADLRKNPFAALQDWKDKQSQE